MKNSIQLWLQKEKLQLNVDQLEHLPKQHLKEKLLEELQQKKQQLLREELQQNDDNFVSKLTIVI